MPMPTFSGWNCSQSTSIPVCPAVWWLVPLDPRYSQLAFCDCDADQETVGPLLTSMKTVRYVPYGPTVITVTFEESATKAGVPPITKSIRVVPFPDTEILFFVTLSRLPKSAYATYCPPHILLIE